MDASQIVAGRTYRRTDIADAQTRVDRISRNGDVIGHTFGRCLSTACVIPIERFVTVIEHEVDE